MEERIPAISRPGTAGPAVTELARERAWTERSPIVLPGDEWHRRSEGLEALRTGFRDASAA
jgi:hypothetical protein